MRYTEVLNLPILEGNDTLRSMVTQSNAISSQLEELFGSNLSDYRNLSNITADIDNLENEVNSLDARCLENETNINTLRVQLNNRIDDVISNKYRIAINDGGTIKNGTIEFYTFNALCSGSVSSAIIPIDENNRTGIYSQYGSIQINARDVADITTLSNVKILNAIAMINDYTPPLAITSKFDFNGVFKLPNNNDFYFNFSAQNITIRDEHKISGGGWAPSGVPNAYQDKNVDVTIILFREDN